MTNNISIRHLRAFVEVANSGSFTRAAESLHLTQSTLTATIKQLEAQAGLKLFDRTTRRVLLSGEGEHFLPVAEKLISDFDTAFNDLQATATQQQGKVGIAASPSMISRLLPPVIKQYHAKFPNIRLYLRDDNASGIEQRVLDNDVDFGIGGDHSQQPELNYHPILNDQYGVILPPQHPLAKQVELSWQSIHQQPQIHLSADTGTRSQLLAFAHQHQIQLATDNVLIEVSTPAGLAEMVRIGLGISLLPALAASTKAFDGLKFIPLSSPAMYRQIYIISRKGRALGPAADAMLELIKQHFTQDQLPEFTRL